MTASKRSIARGARARLAAAIASILSIATLGSLAASTAGAAPGNDSSAFSNDAKTAVSLSGWPNVSGITVVSNGTIVAPVNGVYWVNARSPMTLYAAGVELASLAPKSNVTVFDLVTTRSCGSSTDLAKVISLLLSLDADGNAANGIQINLSVKPNPSQRLARLSETSLLALEVQLTGRSIALQDALLVSNAALDQETWAENLAARTAFPNDMSVLQSYLDRVFANFALDPNSLEGVAHIAPAEIASVPATFKNEGIAFDGDTPVFSWRYGLQRTDAKTYQPTLAYPLALPADIQGVYDTIGNKPDYGHIGDIEIANGKLYAPIEDEDNSQLQSYIAIFDPKTLQYTGEKHALPLALHDDGVPWVAVDSDRKELYTVTWSGAPAGSVNVFDLDTFALKRTVPMTMTFDGRRVQGAKVHDGMLYATGDSHDAGATSGTNRKYLYKVDTVSGNVITLFSFDEPNRTEVEGLAFSPDGIMHVIVLAPYTTPLYATGTHNPKAFDGSYSVDGDDWNPSATLRHYTRTAAPLRDQLCKM